MATVKEKGEGKSGFLKEYFVDHPDAGKATIDEAWQDAGNEGTISDSLIYKVRSDLGLTGKARTKAEVSGKAGAGKQSSAAPESSARRTGPKAEDRTTAGANGRHTTVALGRPVEPRAVGDDRTRVLIRLEDQIDDMIHEIKLAGGLPEFEETLRKARRILVRSYEE
jgi:hypothetical protein